MQKMLNQWPFTFRNWNICDMTFPDSVDAADGWLLTGSRHGVYENHVFISPLENFIRDIAKAQKPMVGICFGHQIIAKAFGSRVEKSTKGWGLGPQSYQSKTMGDIVLNAWHQDQVLTLPKGAICLAGNDHCHYAVLRYDFAPILTVQPHPEFSRDIICDFAQWYRGMLDYTDEGLAKAAEKARSVEQDDSARFGHLIGEFYTKHAQA